MKIYNLFLTAFIVCLFACNQNSPKEKAEEKTSGLTSILDAYYEERLHYFPLEATAIADNRFNNQLPCDISESYREKLKIFYTKYLLEVVSINRESLSEEEQVSFDVFKREMEMQIQALGFKDHLMPINQFWSMPLTFAQLGSGSGNQPFKTLKDYEDFLGRISDYVVWTDTAVSNMKRGLALGITPPKVLMEKVIPQLSALLTSDIKESVFYTPLKKMPESMDEKKKARIIQTYTDAIQKQINPSIKKLRDFIKDEYAPKCRTSHGISEIPGGNEYYAYLVKYWTTTNNHPDSIFETGKREVARIKAEMENIKNSTGFKGDLKSFFKFIHDDAKFKPFKKEEDVLAAYRNIESRMKDSLNKLFNIVPKAKFEIRQTEKFREASASAEYSPSAPDGSRPGIFYVPIVDVKNFNNIGMEDLFLHEAIPGHHYQISIQQENTKLPKFRRYSWYGAYGEGWALYTESLGKELGLYSDPYQYFGSLSEEMHRAIRLVVDVGIHTKKWTREDAITYSMENEAASEAEIVSEVERYMAIPAQALAYKTGQLKIIELRKKAEKLLGNKFNIQAFHDKILIEGCLPLDVFENQMSKWIYEQTNLAFK